MGCDGTQSLKMKNSKVETNLDSDRHTTTSCATQLIQWKEPHKPMFPILEELVDTIHWRRLSMSPSGSCTSRVYTTCSLLAESAGYREALKGCAFRIIGGESLTSCSFKVTFTVLTSESKKLNLSLSKVKNISNRIYLF